MGNADFTTVDRYVASQPEFAQSALARVRRAVRKAVPEAEELISYKMPSYELQGESVLQFAGWKQHYSLIPSQSAVVAFCDELAPYEIEKGTINFPPSKPVPMTLLQSNAPRNSAPRKSQHSGV